MLKKIMILAMAAMALAALSAPMASAKWQHKGGDLVGNPHVLFTGQAKFFNGILGGIECQTDATVELTGGTTTAHIKQFEVDLTEANSTVTSKCKTSGPLEPCFVTSVQSTNLPWIAHTDGADTINITTGTIHNVLESAQHGACGVAQSVTLEPAAPNHTVHATITAGDTKAIKQVHLSGSLTSSTGFPLQIQGTQNVTPSGTYGTI